MLDFWKRLPPERRGKGPQVIQWIEDHCVYSDGQWIGLQTRLLLWQKIFILALFALGEGGIRLFRWCLLGVPKKNGKTQLAAWLALYFLIGDGEPSPLVVCAAASDDQADLVYGAAKICAERSPTLSQICECYDKEILVPSIPGARLKRVAAVSGTNDGQNIYVVICDELHEWIGAKGRNVWTVLTNGTGARREPLVLQITTAGADPGVAIGEAETVCGEQYLLGQRILSGEVTDPRYLYCWVSVDDALEYRAPENWELANPSWGTTLPYPEAFFRDQLTKKRESEFRRYFLNQWTTTFEAWIPSEVWGSLKVEAVPWFDPERPIFVATDASTKLDSTAHLYAQWTSYDPATRKLRVAAQIWERPAGPDGKPLDEWKLPIADVENRLRDAHQVFRITAAGYDPALFERSAQQLEIEGLPMVEIPQSDARMVPACQATYELIMQGRLEHNGDPVLARHIGSAVAVEAHRGGWRIKKAGSKARMDAAVALVMAVSLAVEPPVAEPQVPSISFH